MKYRTVISRTLKQYTVVTVISTATKRNNA
jgi:hypothetical protein